MFDYISCVLEFSKPFLKDLDSRKWLMISVGKILYIFNILSGPMFCKSVKQDIFNRYTNHVL